VPPDLDLTPLARSVPRNPCFETLLNSLPGLTCLLSRDGTVESAGERWDDLAARIAQPQWSHSAVLGRSFCDLFPDQESQQALQTGLANLAQGRSKQITQLLDFGLSPKNLIVNWLIQPIHEEGRCTGFIAQGLDVTQDLATRGALLDRERKVRELKLQIERHNAEMTTLQKQMERFAADREGHVLSLLTSFRAEPGSFAPTLCRLTCELTGAVGVDIALYDAASRRFTFATQHGPREWTTPPLDAEFYAVEMGESAIGLAAQNGCATKFENFSARNMFSPWAERARDLGWDCLWSVPLEDVEGLYGTLQLYFAESDKPLPVDQYASLSAVCQAAVPLLRASAVWPCATPAAVPECDEHPSNAQGFRVLAAGLSEEFSNLLTGVLGHSSLAAAEVGENHTALADVRAIEKAARSAARLTRHLSALCGSARRVPAPMDLAAYLKQLVYSEDNPVPLHLSVESCLVPMEPAALDVILGGMAEQAGAFIEGAVCAWSLEADREAARLTLRGDACTPAPSGWEAGRPANPHGTIPEIFYAREAARAAGGDIEFVEEDGAWSVSLVLPLTQHAVV
jgi:hypothetical protein